MSGNEKRRGKVYWVFTAIKSVLDAITCTFHPGCLVASQPTLLRTCTRRVASGFDPVPVSKEGGVYKVNMQHHTTQCLFLVQLHAWQGLW